MASADWRVLYFEFKIQILATILISPSSYKLEG